MRLAVSAVTGTTQNVGFLDFTVVPIGRRTGRGRAPFRRVQPSHCFLFSCAGWVGGARRACGEGPGAA